MPWSDEQTPLAELKDRIRRFSAERSWARYHKPRNLAMQVSVEAAELLELYLWSADDGPQPPVEGRSGKVEEEAADVLIALLNLCAVTGIDLCAAVERKLVQNAEKYPVEKAWGRLEKYDELSTPILRAEPLWPVPDLDEEEVRPLPERDERDPEPTRKARPMPGPQEPGED